MVTKEWMAHVWLALAALLVLETAHAAAQGPVRTFSELQHVLSVGQRVSITEQQGYVTTVTKGELVSITRDTVEIRLPGPVFFVRGKTYAVDENSVSRIESAHRIWKGAAIGAVAGGLASLALVRAGVFRDEDESGMLIVLIPTMGAALGDRIEEKMQQRLIYVSPPRMPTSLPRPPRRPFIAAKVRF